MYKKDHQFVSRLGRRPYRDHVTCICMFAATNPKARFRHRMGHFQRVAWVPVRGGLQMLLDVLSSGPATMVLLVAATLLFAESALLLGVVLPGFGVPVAIGVLATSGAMGWSASVPVLCAAVAAGASPRSCAEDAATRTRSQCASRARHSSTAASPS